MNNIHILPLTVAQKLEEIGIPQDSVIFYQNNRWVYQVGHQIPDDNRLCYQPIDSLGPFGEYFK